jgi:hypothetical protein
MLNELKQQKADALNYWKRTGDRNVRAYMIKLDTKIKKLLQEKGQKNGKI